MQERALMISGIIPKFTICFRAAGGVDKVCGAAAGARDAGRDNERMFECVSAGLFPQLMGTGPECCRMRK